jgi:aspartate kinase
LADASINVDMIVQNISPDGKTTDITFTVPESGLSARAHQSAWKTIAMRSASRTSKARADVVKVSVIGIGMRSHAGVAAQCFPRFGEQGHQHPCDHNLGNQDFRSH